MRSRHLNTARFYVAHMAWVSSDTLLNSLIFDRGFTSDLDEGGGVIKAGLRLIPIARLSPATQLEWNSEFLKPGDSLTGIPLLVKECKDGVDYVILLTADSAERVAKEYKVNFINTKIIEIRNALLKTGQLSPVSDVIQDSPSEQFVVYRVTRKIQPN
jgi:hypothetical protein